MVAKRPNMFPVVAKTEVVAAPRFGRLAGPFWEVGLNGGRKGERTGGTLRWLPILIQTQHQERLEGCPTQVGISLAGKGR